MGVIAKSAIPLFFTMNVSEQRSYKKKKSKWGSPSLCIKVMHMALRDLTNEPKRSIL
jgi:hypothetical protein